MRRTTVPLFGWSPLLALLVATMAAATPARATITFSSTPPQGPSGDAEVSLGSTFTYDVDAVSSAGGDVRYALSYGPSGMTVDAASGEVSWTPSARGVYPVELRAYLADDPTTLAKQRWTIVVSECGGTSVISGTVRFDGGSPVMKGTVTARLLGGGTNPRKVVAAPIAAGSYSLRVDAGTYLLQVQGEKFLTEWYRDALTFSSATPIEVGCGTVVADLSVAEMGEMTGIVGVGGRVVSAADNMPQANMDVLWAAYRRDIPEKYKWEMMARRLSSGPAMLSFVDRTMTKADGTFRASGSTMKGYKYLFGVQPRRREGDMPEIFQQLFSYAADPASAELLDLSDGIQRTDVNFLISPNAPNGVIMRGEVFDTAGRPMQAWISALKLIRDSDGRWQADPMASRTVLTHKDIWISADSGEYVLFVIPGDHNYLPGYYGADGRLMPDPDGAIAIRTDTIGLETRFNVYPSMADSSSGRSQLRGEVTGIRGRAERDGGGTRSLRTISGALVTALDSAGRGVSFDFSDDEGNYALENLREGEYTIVIARPGERVASMKAYVTGDGEIIRRDVAMQLAPAAAPLVAAAGQARSLVVTPNPAPTSARIAFDAEAGSARIVVTDVAGREVYTRTIETEMGRTTVDVPTSGLAAGAYVVTIRTGESTVSGRIDVAR